MSPAGRRSSRRRRERERGRSRAAARILAVSDRRPIRRLAPSCPKPCAEPGLGRRGWTMDDASSIRRACRGEHQLARLTWSPCPCSASARWCGRSGGSTRRTRPDASDLGGGPGSRARRRPHRSVIRRQKRGNEDSTTSARHTTVIRRLINMGDTVVLDEHYGTVEDVTLTHTTVRIWN